MPTPEFFSLFNPTLPSLGVVGTKNRMFGLARPTKTNSLEQPPFRGPSPARVIPLLFQARYPANTTRAIAKIRSTKTKHQAVVVTLLTVEKSNHQIKL